MRTMEMIDKHELSTSLKSVRMPKYGQLPNMGLYLEQTTKYINQVLEPLGYVEITASMIRNYVKMGLVKKPIQKAYYADHIAHLISITILKLVLPLENIRKMFELQEKVYMDDVAFDYFSMELENMISYSFGLSDSVKEIGETSSVEKEMLRSAIIAISHIIYFNVCIRLVSTKSVEETVNEISATQSEEGTVL